MACGGSGKGRRSWCNKSMRLTRRNFLQRRWPCPSAFFPRATGPWRPRGRGLSKDHQGSRRLQLKQGQTLIPRRYGRGFVRYGECNTAGAIARSAASRPTTAPAVCPNLALVGKDPLAIPVHFHNMFMRSAAQAARCKSLSGIDMALGDLAGKNPQSAGVEAARRNFRDENPALLARHRRRLPEQKVARPAPSG